MRNNSSQRKPSGASASYMRLLKETKFDFLRFWPMALVISGALVALGIIATVQIFVTNNANLGIEFTGGTRITMQFEERIPLDEARSLLIDNGFANPQVTDARETDVFKLQVRVKEDEGDVAEVPERIASIFERAYPQNAITDRSNMSIGPAVGNELRDKAIYAILYAIAGIILYIAVRFDFKFGVAATVAMFHDALIIVGLMWLKNFFWPTEFTLLIMTAVLTMAGYSLTDTVVVFDRIRENLKRRTKLPLKETINAAINQVLSRTIVTSLTTFLVVAAIYFLGGEALSDFALALIIGVIAGTYSSIFVASPLLVLWRGGRGGRLISEAADVRGGRAQRARSGA